VRADLGISTSRLWTCVARLRTNECVAVWNEVEDLELTLASFASGWLPIAEPRRGSRELEWAHLLLDTGHWYLRYRGVPVVSQHGGSKIDEFMSDLELLFGAKRGCDEVLFGKLADHLRAIQFRRSMLYSAIANGVSDRLLEYTGSAPSDMRRQLVQGDQATAAWRLRMALRKVGCIYAALPDAELEWLRVCHAELVMAQAPDTDFVGLIDRGWSRQVLELLLEKPIPLPTAAKIRRRRRKSRKPGQTARVRKPPVELSWRILTASLFGIRPSRQSEREPQWWCNVAPSGEGSFEAESVKPERVVILMPRVPAVDTEVAA
jgi:hypothetical protein